MSQFADFYRYILPFAKGVPEPAMDNALRTIAQEVCTKTFVWQGFADAIGLTAKTSDYDLDAPDDGEVATVIEVYYNGLPAELLAFNQLSMYQRNWLTQTGDVPKFFYQIDPDILSVAPIPETSQPGVLRLRIAYRPTETADTLPDILLKEFADGMAHGALSIILLEEDVPYTNPEKAGAYGASYLGKRDSLGVRVQKNFGRASLRSRGRYF